MNLHNDICPIYKSFSNCQGTIQYIYEKSSTKTQPPAEWYELFRKRLRFGTEISNGPLLEKAGMEL